MEKVPQAQKVAAATVEEALRGIEETSTMILGGMVGLHRRILGPERPSCREARPEPPSSLPFMPETVEHLHGILATLSDAYDVITALQREFMA